jgi:predicted ferric reductase
MLTTNPAHDLTRRSHFLDGWDASEIKGLSYSWGLTGVDQKGNYRWVDVFLYVLLVLGLLLLGLRFANMFWRHTRHLAAMGSDRQVYWERNQTRWWPWLNRHLLQAPLHKKKHNASFQISSAIDNGTLPGRWHMIMLVIYVVMNLAFCLALPWSNPDQHAIIAALRGRSGTLAALNLVPTVLFALRNNPLIPLLQVSYDDFNLFHRWGARICIAETIVHTSCWLHNTRTGDGWQAVVNGLRDEQSYTWGMVASSAFVFMGIQAWSPFRHAFYETFLNIHRFCAMLTFVGVYLHLHYHALPQVPWMYLVFIFYGGELLMRSMYILYYNIRHNKKTSIRVEAMPGEAVRLTITLAGQWQPRPGCHVHMYMPALALWSSHPFSVAWAYPPKPSSTEKTYSMLEGGESTSSQTTNQISLICRARTGLTRKMYEKACRAPNTHFNTWGFIEGPYGGHHSLDSYGTCVLFAGGVGITHQVMYLKHLIEGAENGTTATQRILLAWTVPNSECLEWVRPWMDEVLQMKGRKRVLRIKLFISRPKGRIDAHPSTSVQMFAGRMSAETILEQEMKDRVGAMAVTVCASGAMADSVRAATRKHLEEGSVDFIEEAFTY